MLYSPNLSIIGSKRKTEDRKLSVVLRHVSFFFTKPLKDQTAYIFSKAFRYLETEVLDLTRLRFFNRIQAQCKF